MLPLPNRAFATPALSVVICFRDWGLDRLAVAIKSHFANAKGIEIEVVVSDYGSKNSVDIRDVISPLGATVIRTDTDRPWSRSAALNIGVVAAKADTIITTDADIIFSSGAYVKALHSVSFNSNVLYLVQCRDLPEGLNCQKISSMLEQQDFLDIENLDAASSIRPRWGMGGFAAFNKSAFFEINGYEERMQIWGKEDTDFALRFKRARRPVRWLTDPDVRIYHIWHEYSQAKALETGENIAALNKNAQILEEDNSIVRNIGMLSLKTPKAPLVSVIIPTYKRHDLLFDALGSCLCQTFDNFEVLVVENGDSVGAEKVVEVLGDKRIRYFKSEKSGAAAARNLGIRYARGRYVLIHDDDDIMVSTRIEDHLRALKADCHGTYGGWIDFEHETGDVTGLNTGKEFSFNSLMCNSKVVVHGSTMLDIRILRIFPYNESLKAGIDYGLFLNLARNGLRLLHTGKFGILRRMHATNMTNTIADVQKESAGYMVRIIKAEIGDSQYKTFREIGLAVNSMVCDNEKSSLDELANYKRSGVRVLGILLDSKDGKFIKETGTGVQNFACKNESDAGGRLRAHKDYDIKSEIIRNYNGHKSSVFDATELFLRCRITDVDQKVPAIAMEFPVVALKKSCFSENKLNYLASRIRYISSKSYSDLAVQLI